jgi:hypothetical protein
MLGLLPVPGDPPITPMTLKEARQWVRDHDDADELDEKELEEAFRAIFGRDAVYADREQGLWSHLCAAEEVQEE